MSRYSEQQLRLLAVLPDPPSDGKLCKGSELNTANSLARVGLTKQVRVENLSEDVCRYYFVRTQRGRALAEGRS